MRERETVKVLNVNFDEVEIDGELHIILRGILDPDSLGLLQVGTYQRGNVSRKAIDEIVDGFKEGLIPDVELGVRDSEDYTPRGEVIYIPGDVFIIDGLQRVTAGKIVLSEGVLPHLGAVIHFGTTEEWERKRFEVLNFKRTRVSPNVRLRNKGWENTAVGVVRDLSNSDRGFALNGRVSWGQYMQRGHLVTAFTLLKTVGMLHGHLGHSRGSKVDGLADGLVEIMERIGEDTFRRNVRGFFDVVDQCWGVKTVSFHGVASQTKVTFLTVLAGLFSDHPIFWRGDRFFMDKDLIVKLRAFNIGDPEVVRLAGSAGQARGILYDLLLRHINSGKRTKRLIARENEE